MSIFKCPNCHDEPLPEGRCWKCGCEYFAVLGPDALRRVGLSVLMPYCDGKGVLVFTHPNGPPEFEQCPGCKLCKPTDLTGTITNGTQQERKVTVA